MRCLVSVIQIVMSCIRVVKMPHVKVTSAGWSSLVARRAHNPKVVGSNPAPATILYGLV
jgi:hypothetical protein